MEAFNDFTACLAEVIWCFRKTGGGKRADVAMSCDIGLLSMWQLQETIDLIEQFATVLSNLQYWSSAKHSRYALRIIWA